MYYVRVFPNWSNIDQRVYNFIPIGPFDSVEEAESWYRSERERDAAEGICAFCDMEMDVVLEKEASEVTLRDDTVSYIPLRDPSVVRDAALWEAIENESARIIFVPNAG